MNTLLIIIGVIAIAVAAIIILQKKGIIGDRDGESWRRSRRIKRCYRPGQRRNRCS